MIAGVRGSRAFTRFRENGRRAATSTLAIIKVDSPELSVAFAVNRRVGNAVVRNRLRRRMRALLDGYDATTLTAGQYLIIPTPAAASLSFADLDDALRATLAKFS